MSREEQPVTVAQRYSQVNDCPLEYPFTQNKRNHLFDFILHQFFFVDPAQRLKNSRLFLERTSLLNLPPKAPVNDKVKDWEVKHKIDYSIENTELHKFLRIVNTILQIEVLQGGLSRVKYHEFWKAVEDRENCTALVTILLARLLKMETDLLNKPFLKYPPPTKEKVREIIDTFKMVEEEWNEDAERLMEHRDQNLAKKVYMNSDLFGSFLQVYTQHSRKSFNTRFGGAIREDQIVDMPSLQTAVAGPDEVPKKLEFTEMEVLERQAITNLLVYLITMYNFHYEERTLLKIIAEWMKLRNGESDILMVNKIPTALGGKAGEKQESMPTVLVDTTHKLFETCVDFESPEEMSLTHGTIIPPFHTMCPASMLDGVNYFKLRNLFRVNAKEVLTVIIKHLNLPNANVCNIFKFLKYSLKHLYLHQSYRQLLEIVNVCKKYFLEPMPVGGLARDLIIMCKKELSFPNYNMRRCFENILDDKKENTREVHILFNPYATNASALRRFVLDENNVEESEEAMLSVKANFVLNIFAYHLNKGKDKPELLKTPPEVLAFYYKDVTEYLETMYDLEPVDMKEYVKKIRGKLSDFRNQVENHPTDEIKKVVGSFKREWYPELPHLKYRLVPLQKEESLTHTRRMRRTIPHTLYYKVLRKIILERKKKKVEGDALRPETKISTIAVAIAGGSGSVQRLAHAINTLNDSKVSLDVKLKVYIIPLGTNNLLAQWAAQNDPFYRRLFFNPIMNRIGVFPSLKDSSRKIEFTPLGEEETEGEDETGAVGGEPVTGSPQKGGGLVAEKKEVGELGSMNCSKSRLFRELDERFYNTIAPVRTGYKPREDYMALVSMINEEEEGRATELSDYEPSFDIVTPHSYYTSLLRNYFISSTKEVPICCYSTQCLRFQVMPNLMVIPKPLEMITMSFCQRVEIGYFAELMQFRKEKNMTKMSLRDVARNGFKFTPIGLNISYVPMSISGEFLKSKKIQVTTKQYVSCQIKNVSLCGDVGERVSPDRKSLEVFLEDTKRKKKKGRDYEKSFRAAEISVESPNHVSFSVLFDGELYGPFHRILINSYKGDQFFLQTMS